MSAKRSGGTGFQPVSFFKITRRNLPHWQEPERVYFINWRCKKDHTLSPEERTITLEALRYWDDRKWTIYAAVVMVDHIHALAQPFIQSESGTFLIQRASIRDQFLEDQVRLGG
jgi:REP element-mobilizing transposase RayT